MNKIRKIFSVIQRWLVKKLVYVDDGLYMKYYTNYLRKIGVVIHGTPKFISPDAYFDGTDYSKIVIGDNVTISREVMFLTHDYSITSALASIGEKIPRGGGEVFFLKDITIGENCFIGARVSILPGTSIGDNVIIGTCSVVKGKIPNNSIVVGNPYEIIGKTDAYAMLHKKKNDYLIEK
ncbi:acyltransferase [Clostridium vincentii]|uniref:Maltose O-acetyltransferase n=1 Tax=Clostridium vincentii TaxID=52704 RepID=A0A2T0BJS5_9CLOT|nr:acyltransferase [Clostridium vincentii]PRR84083.1 Maltose O-acetyltransferase [Clostridium vincentii]